MTPKVRATITGDWQEVTGAAASVAGMNWQNDSGLYPCLIAFTTAAPTATDAQHRLDPGRGFYDVNGSAHIWARPVDASMTVVLCGSAN